MLGTTIADEWETMDRQVSLFIEYLWETGESRNDAADICSGIQHFLMTRKKLPGAWRLISTWSHVELPVRAPPMPPLVMVAMVGLCIHIGEWGMGASLLCVWHCFLRTAEIMEISGATFQLDHLCQGVLSLGLTKAGKRRGAAEMCVLTCQATGWMLQEATKRLPRGMTWW